MAGKVQIIDDDKEYKKLMRSIKKAAKGHFVEVGYFSPGVATYAAVNEFGSRDGDIPERPFMRSTVDSGKSKYNKMLDAAGDKVTEGVEPAAALFPLANELRNDVIDSIINWTEPENAESTVKQKKVNNPLVATGEMQRALEVKVVK